MTIIIFKTINRAILIVSCLLFLTQCVEYIHPDMACTENQHCFQGQLCNQQSGMCVSVDKMGQNDIQGTKQPDPSDTANTQTDTSLEIEEVNETEVEIQDTEEFDEPEPEEEIVDTEEFHEPETEEEILDTEELTVDAEEEIEDIHEIEPPECEHSDNCTNNLFCDGEEHCNEDGECINGSLPCLSELCDEENNICLVPAFMTEGSILLENNSTVDSFNSTSGIIGLSTALIATNSILDNAVQIDNSRILGNLFIGQDGDVESVISLTNSGEVTGNIASLHTYIPLKPVLEPNYQPGNEDEYEDFEESELTMIFDSDRYFGRFDVMDGTIIIRGDITILCTRGFKIIRISLELEPGAHLQLYLKRTEN